MKVLLVNTYEKSGGAAIAAGRLLHALQQQTDLSVSLLVRDRKTSAYQKCLTKFRFAFERAVIFWGNKLSRQGLFRVSIANTGSDISKLPEVQEADIVHLHWVNQAFLSLRDLHALQCLNKPIVWTLHDLWPATGICHYPDSCTAYHTCCKSCPQMVSKPWLNLSRWVFKKKSRLDFSNTTFVGCSQWIADMAQQSAFLSQAHFCSIPNPIDTNAFHPMDRTQAREKFQWSSHRRIILFVAAKTTDPRKGITYLAQACQKLYQQGVQDFDLALLGSQSDDLIKLFPCTVHSLGFLSAPADLCAAYSAADVFAIPSLEDNLPNTIMEAMACGTPCVGFHVGGIPEMIDHLQNGYVAQYKSVDDLVCGIQTLLALPEDAYRSYSESCRNKVLQSYSEAVVAAKFKELYQQAKG